MRINYAHTHLSPCQQNNVVTTRKPPSSRSHYSRSNNQVFTQPGQPAPPSAYSNSHHSGGHSTPPSNDSTESSAVFDSDHVLSHTLLTELASATSVSSQELCQPFLRNGRILTASSTEPILFDRFLLDTGAQGSNFISAQTYSLIPVSHLQSTRHIDKIVRLGDARHLSVQLEVLRHTSILWPLHTT